MAYSVRLSLYDGLAFCASRSNWRSRSALEVRALLNWLKRRNSRFSLIGNLETQALRNIASIGLSADGSAV
jgi:hypothetical protein